MECFFCKDHEDLLIKKYKYWTITLHTNQCYLGRCTINLNRHIVDLFDINEEERKELFEVMIKLRNAMKELFKPDLFNYASLGNTDRHLHLHFIPRYAGKREFDGVEFVDEKWGKNYTPYNKEFKIPNSVFNNLRKLIKEKIS